jgi:hypothetical protein
LVQHFMPGNAYAHFPLYVPKTMQANIRKRGDGVADKYTWARPGSSEALWTRGFTGDKYMQHMTMLLKDVKVDRTLVSALALLKL